MAIDKLGGIACAGLSFIDGPNCPVPSNQWKPFGDEPIWGDVGETTEVDGVVWTNVGPIRDEDVEKEFHILPMPPIPSEAWQFIEDAQRLSEVITGGTKKVLDKEVDPWDDCSVIGR